MPWEGDHYYDQNQEAEPSIQSCDDDEERRQAARRWFLDAPPYRIDFEPDGSLSLCMKHYEWWEDMQPEHATTWRRISRHADLEDAERRLRHLCSGPHFYDAEGRLTRTPGTARPRWTLPPEDE